MQNSVRACLYFLAICSICGVSAQAQDAALALSTSVGYNTQRLSLQLSAEQANEAARLGEEATKATRAGKFGDALNDYAHGLAVMHGIAWTPAREYASSLRAKLDHAMIAPGTVTLNIAPFYPVQTQAAAPKIGAKAISATVVLVQATKDVSVLAAKAEINPAHMPFTEPVKIPADATGDYVIEVRLTEAGSSAPEVKLPLPIHVEDLSADAKRLRDSLAKAGANNENPAIATAQYSLALYERADKGEVNPRAYDFRKEFATAQAIVDAVQAGKDPFAGTHGDMRKAYLSVADRTLQPYRLFIPTAYDGSKSLPLVVALHGMGGDENSMFDSYGKELPVDCEKAGFILAAPKGRGPASMYRGTAEQDVLDVLAEVERDYKVDTSRVYLMGHSMGGFGTWSIAMDHPDLFAALGPISGGGDANGMAKIRNIPQYVTHGDDDRTVNVSSSRTMVEAGKKVGASITYVEVPGGSHSGVAQGAFAPMMEFFGKQSKTPAVSAK